MKTKIEEQTFLRLEIANGVYATYIATRAKNDVNGNPRYNITIVYGTYAEMAKNIKSYNIVKTIKDLHTVNHG